MLTGYRVHISGRLALLSLGRAHNELGNMWTHLGGALAFAALFGAVYRLHLARLRSRVHLLVLTAYTAAVVWLLLCSASFHTFNCCSPSAYSCTARLDYSGIGIVILASQWSAMVYAFQCWREAFLGNAVVLGIFTVLAVVGPMFKFFHSNKLRVARALMYVCLAILFPVVWFLMLGFREGFASPSVVNIFYTGMGLTYLGYGFGIVFYIFRIPERFFPGKVVVLCFVFFFALSAHKDSFQNSLIILAIHTKFGMLGFYWVLVRCFMRWLGLALRGPI